MITDLKDLEKFLKICRKQGVSDITFENIVVKFGDLPTKSAPSEESSGEIETDALTDEELMFHAVMNQGPV